MFFKNKNRAISYISVLIIIVGSSCKKFVEVGPPVTSINSNNVYTNDATAAAVLTQLYADMSFWNSNMNSVNNNITDLSLTASLAVDELTLFNLNSTYLLPFYRNDLSVAAAPTYWITCYSELFNVNSAIEGLTNSSGLTPSVKNQLMGEAKFMRAFFYFYLVNLYGNVPLVLDLNYKANATLSRTPVASVYEQIIKDLTEAKQLISPNFLSADIKTVTPDRVRPTRWAVSALLARVYLYTGNWAKAESEATEIINSPQFVLETSLNQVFKKSSRETIWQLQPVVSTAGMQNTGEGRTFKLPTTGPNTNINPVYLSNQLLNAFEPGDKRAIRGNWIDSVKVSNGTVYYYPNKYQIGNVNVTPAQEYPIIFRLAEQYLIRAEARAQNSNSMGSQSDLNAIRNRAGLGNTTASSKDQLLASILQERRVELFTEWAHRWFDLKRTGQLDAVMSAITPQKAIGAPWRPFQALFPIPQVEMTNGINLVQNVGY